MADTVMKFGPEWLRVLSDGGTNVNNNSGNNNGGGNGNANNNNNISSSSSFSTTNTSQPKYKLAEHRYGREEMLALFTEDTIITDELRECQEIVSEKCQTPVALLPISDEEHRLWSKCINSEVVIRLAGKNGTNNGLPERERVPERGGGGSGGVGSSISGGGNRTRSIGGGANSSASGNGSSTGSTIINTVSNDRGRGRGRPIPGFLRGLSGEDEADPTAAAAGSEGGTRREFRTGKSFEERPFNRPAVDPNDETSTILKKDPRAVDNWRSSDRGRNDDRSWRNRNRQEEGRSRVSSWRADERDRDSDEREYRNGPMGKRAFHKNSNDQWEDWDDDDKRSSLPEWSLDDNTSCEAKVGTFDSSGAFREDISESEQHRDERERKVESPQISAKESIQSQKESDLSHQQRHFHQKKSQSHEAEENEQSMVNQVKEHQKQHQASAHHLNTSSVDVHQPLFDGVNAAPTNITNSSQQQQLLLQKQQQQHQQQHQQHHLTENKPSLPPEITHNTIEKPIDNLPQMKHDEDNFAHIETMVAQWTAEEDDSLNQRTSSKLMVLPVNHEDAFKWFYRDPQGELQGPFSPQEMLDWFSLGYFTMDLLVRRGCDELFSQLGELIKTWNRVPFIPGQNPAPIRVSSNSPSLASSIPVTQNNIQLRILQQQQLQKQMILNQQMQMQNELRQLLANLKQQEGFTDLSQQQQQEVLVQQYVQQRRTAAPHQMVPVEQQQHIAQSQLQQQVPQAAQIANNPLMPLVVPMMRPPLPVVAAGNPVLAPAQPAPPSIWDLNGTSGVMTASALEEMHRQEIEEAEKQKLFEEEQIRKKIEEENQRRILAELQKKLEEDRKRKEEYVKQQEEQERLKREEEERLRMEEEERRIKEQQRRQEEIKRLEELSRKQKLEEEKELERRRREAEDERIRQQQQQQQQQEMEKQRQYELEMAMKKEKEEALKRIQEQKKAWGAQQMQQQNITQNTVSLAEIQKMQEIKELEERQAHIQRMQNFYHAQQMQQQQQQQQQQQLQGKQQLPWSSNANRNTPVKTLAEIQKEESERAAKQKQVEEQKQAQQSSIIGAGIWNNAASQLSWKPSSIPWDTSTSSTTQNVNTTATNKSNQATAGFWDNETNTTATNAAAGANRKITPTSNKSKESALQQQQQQQQSNKNTGNSKSKSNSSFRATKEEEEVMKLFENQRRSRNDEFTNWCKEALEKFQTFVDVPTFVAFLKDVDSPFEVNEYVVSYLGDTKETREFAKMFIEKRSYYKNLAKKAELNEEAVWCPPPPPVTPSAKKSVSFNFGGDSDSAAGYVKAVGKKKKKGKKMVDASILGFTVQADPDRVNVGEIEKVND